MLESESSALPLGDAPREKAFILKNHPQVNNKNIPFGRLGDFTSSPARVRRMDAHTPFRAPGEEGIEESFACL